MSMLIEALKRIRQDLRGAKVLAEWLGDGAHPVAQEVANRRALACINCPGKYNRLNHRRLENSVAEAIRNQESVRGAVKLATPLDGRLHSCTECGCYLKLKIWVPLENQSDQEMPSYCWVTRERKDSNWKPTPRRESPKGTVIIERNGALGDIVLATGIATALYKKGYSVGFRCDEPLRPVLENHPHLYIDTSKDVAKVVLNGVWEREPNRGRIDRRASYWWTAKNQLKPHGIDLDGEMPAPVLGVTEQEKSDALIELLTLPRPFIAVNPRSRGWINRQIADSIWEKTAGLVEGTKIWLGEKPAPNGFFDPKIRTIRRLMAFIAVSDKLVSPDTGPVHIACALRVPTTVITGPFRPEIMLPLHDGVKWNQVVPQLDCIGCGDYKCRINVEQPPCVKVDPATIANVIRDL